MPCKPITQMAGGKSQRQRVWEAIRRHAANGDGHFTWDDLSRTAKVEYDPLSEYLKGLVAGGWISIVVKGARGVKNVYRLEKDNGIEAPRVRRDGSEVTQGHGNEAMWGAITVLDTFTAQVIADLSGAAAATAKTYCMMLARAGYIEAVEEGKGNGKGGKPTVFRTVKSRVTGPRAPMITRLKAVYDPNVHAVVWSEGADEAVEATDHA